MNKLTSVSITTHNCYFFAATNFVGFMSLGVGKETNGVMLDFVSETHHLSKTYGIKASDS